jgi:hypothetical protein
VEHRKDLMICSLPLDPRFKKYAVQLRGLSRGEECVWGVVKDSATRHKRFEKACAADHVEAEVSVFQSPPKRIKTGFVSSSSALMDEGAPASSSSPDPSRDSQRMPEVAIKTYREMLLLSQDADPLQFWEANATNIVLQPLLPLVSVGSLCISSARNRGYS